MLLAVAYLHNRRIVHRDIKPAAPGTDSVQCCDWAKVWGISASPPIMSAAQHSPKSEGKSSSLLKPEPQRPQTTLKLSSSKRQTSSQLRTQNPQTPFQPLTHAWLSKLGSLFGYPKHLRAIFGTQNGGPNFDNHPHVCGQES